VYHGSQITSLLGTPEGVITLVIPQLYVLLIRKVLSNMTFSPDICMTHLDENVQKFTNNKRCFHIRSISISSSFPKDDVMFSSLKNNIFIEKHEYLGTKRRFQESVFCF